MRSLRNPATCACPYCGHPVESEAKAFDSLRLARKKRIILEALRKSGGHWIASERLQFAVWGDEIDGGPEDAASCLQAYVAKLRPVLRPLGYQIESSRNVGYRLVRAHGVNQ